MRSFPALFLIGGERVISLSTFLDGIKNNARRIVAYQLGHDGSDGKCDCVGLIIGALRLCGEKYKATHGSNYFARNYTRDLRKIASSATLQPGMLVYKVHNPGESGYDSQTIGNKYKNSGDLRDYYHIGVVQSIKPLCIAHCSVGGMHYDTRVGKWAYCGFCKVVDYTMNDDKKPIVAGEKAVVDTPNDGTLNVRADPRMNGRILLRIREGDSVEILETNGEWARIRAEIGWVQTKFLKASE